MPGVGIGTRTEGEEEEEERVEEEMAATLAGVGNREPTV